ncbi:hypothetical protein ACFLW7_02130 [Chloroflexota bacterium]
MIGINTILGLLELVVFTGHIRGEQPVSTLVTAPPEAGKTSMVMKFVPNEGLVVLTDCTAYGIMRDYGQSIAQGRVKHLVIPDLIKPMSRGKDTVHSLVAFLNALIEEGVVSISTYAEQIGVQSQAGAAQNQTPVRCGLITTMAQGILLDGRHHWARMGFMSRMLPISYTYNAGTQLDIHRSIANRDYLSDTPIRLDLPSENAEIRLRSPQTDDLITLASGLSSIAASANNPERVYGFRLQRQLQGLAMASALKHGRDVVTQEDVDYLRSLSGCVNLEYYPL